MTSQVTRSIKISEVKRIIPSEPVVRYEKLCEAAAQCTKGFLERRARRKQAAIEVSGLIVEYLGVPHGDAAVVEVDANLRATGKRLSSSTDINLQLGDDELWYFGLDIHHERLGATHWGDVTLCIGVDAVDGFVVKNEKLHRVSDLTKESLLPLMEEIYMNILDNYSPSLSKKRSSIGFINKG